MIDTPRTVQFFGISGAGKGTQASLLKDYFVRESDIDVLHMEMGERLRGLASSGSAAARRIAEIQKSGKLVPEFIPSHVLTTFFFNEFSGTEHLVLEGMRRLQQVEVLDEALLFYDRADYAVVVIEISREEAYNRLKLRGRADEAKEAAIQARFDWYERETKPAIQALQERGRRVHHIDGTASIEEIHRAILQELQLS